MYSFICDYAEGAHPKILKSLVENNLVQTRGYGLDPFCDKAKEIIKSKINNQNVDIHFVSGGTQANTIIIDSMLKSYEAVIACSTAHISEDETGAIEACGHKILEYDTADGKLTPELVERAMVRRIDNDFDVMPRAIYISNVTELGTTYTKNELLALREVCDKYKLYLFLDGARLGSSLACEKNDLTLEDYAKICDVFYIGGTKMGALFGEAIVLVNDDLKPHFRYYIKQKGAMFAKGKLMGMQFIELFQDDLYLKLSKHSVDLMNAIKKAFLDNGYSVLNDTHANLLFVVMPNELLEKFDSKYVTSTMGSYDDNHTIVRFVTSWATKVENVQELIDDIKIFKG